MPINDCRAAVCTLQSGFVALIYYYRFDIAAAHVWVEIFWIKLRSKNSWSYRGWAQIYFNPFKTELIWLGTIRRLLHCKELSNQHDNMWCWCPANVFSRSRCPDWQQHDTFESRQNVAGICFYQLRQLHIIRRSLTTDAAHSLVRALIHTRLDYVLQRTPGCQSEVPAREITVRPLCAARLVLQLSHRASALCDDSCTGSECQPASNSNWREVYVCIQMPPWTRSSLPVRSRHVPYAARSSEITLSCYTVAVNPPKCNIGDIKCVWFPRILIGMHDSPCIAFMQFHHADPRNDLLSMPARQHYMPIIGMFRFEKRLLEKGLKLL